MSHTASMLLFLIPIVLVAIALLSAVLVTEIRTYRARLACYRRHAIRSLTRAARKNAIRRFYGGVS